MMSEKHANDQIAIDESTESSQDASVQPIPTKASSLTTTTQDKYMKGPRLWATVLALALGTLLVAIDNTIIAVAIPKISTVFNSLSEVGWYGSAFLLTVTALQPTCARLYKFFNMKIVFLCSILVFEGTIKHSPPLIEQPSSS